MEPATLEIWPERDGKKTKSCGILSIRQQRRDRASLRTCLPIPWPEPEVVSLHNNAVVTQKCPQCPNINYKILYCYGQVLGQLPCRFFPILKYFCRKYAARPVQKKNFPRRLYVSETWGLWTSRYVYCETKKGPRMFNNALNRENILRMP